LSRECINRWNNTGDWVYHLNATTLFAEIRLVNVGDGTRAKVAFATAGDNAKSILRDLQTILNEYR